MFQPHFYGLHSRMGLRHKPHGSQEVNVGVENGPDAVVAHEQFKNAPVDHYHFPQPEAVVENEYLSTLGRESRAAADLIVRTLNSHETPVMVGGDHSIAFASLLAIQDLYPLDQTAVVMFDSHADLHQTATSPSGNFHGMWLRPFFEEFDVPAISQHVKGLFQPTQLCYVGDLIAEEAERAFIKQHSVRQITKADLTLPVDRDQATLAFKEWALAHQHLHVSFDIDMFQADLVPATGTPNPNGLLPEQVWSLLEVVSLHPHVSIDVVEVNPQKPGAATTTELAQRALATMLG